MGKKLEVNLMGGFPILNQHVKFFVSYFFGTSLSTEINSLTWLTPCQGTAKKNIKQQRSHVFYSFEYLISPISSNMKGANQAQSLVNMLEPGLIAYS